MGGKIPLNSGITEYGERLERATPLPTDGVDKAQVNIARLSSVLESSAGVVDEGASDKSALDGKIQYADLGPNTDALYDKDTDTIFLNEQYRGISEPALLQPLIEHEKIHSSYASDTPSDEISLQRYVDEELEAYNTQYATWTKLKNDFYSKYPTVSDRSQLGEPALQLLESHCQLEAMVNENGWNGLREKLEIKYRDRMERLRNERGI